MRFRYPFATFLAISFALLLAYASTSMAMNEGELIPPLDDAFIHFQYAKRAAEGHPFTWQAGDGYSSGATSLIWPFLLVPGLWLGLTGTHLYAWALLLSTVAHAATTWHTWRWATRVSDPRTGLVAALMLQLTGPLCWATFSGMEVVVFAAAIAGVLDLGLREGRPSFGALAWLAVMAGVRPEGALLAGVFAGIRGVRALRAGGARALVPELAWAAPVAIGAVQPLLNLAYTGTMVSSSALAKLNPRMTSHPAETDALRFALERLVGRGFGSLFANGFGDLALVFFAIGAGVLWSRADRWLAAVATACVIVPMALVSVALPIEWHYYRYLMPALAVFVPAMALGGAALDTFVARAGGIPAAPRVLGTLAVAWGLLGLGWREELALAARDIRTLHVGFGRWLATHAPPDATIATNDIGGIAYLGGRRVLDLEGIASAEALPAALAGEGSVWALVRRLRPDAIVAMPAWYPTMFGTGVLSPTMRVVLERRTIAGGPYMVLAHVVEPLAATADRPPVDAGGAEVLDVLDVSDLAEEAAHAYAFDDEPPWSGRANIVISGEIGGATVVDNARRHPRWESFTVRRGAADGRLVGRFGPSDGAARIAVLVDGKLAGRIELPRVADGTWVEAGVPLPGGAAPARVDVVPEDLPPGPFGGWTVGRWWSLGAAPSTP